MNIPESLTNEQQLDIFEQRGMAITNRSQHLQKLSHISYYRIKEFAQPFSYKVANGTEEEIRYRDISFDKVIVRYYRDKNLRINLLHAIEKIEVSIKRNISYILGKKYGAFGYLQFSSWANRNKFSKFEIEERQYRFKKDLLKIIKRTNSTEIEVAKNMTPDGFPTVWLATELLMCGDLVRLVETMSMNNQRKLAKYYDCSAHELVSWLKCLNFARNICAHNSNIIDVELKTKPVIRDEWKDTFLHANLDAKGNPIYSNRLAVIIFITIFLVIKINKDYRLKSIRSNVVQICKDSNEEIASKNSRQLGFKDSKTALDFKGFANLIVSE